MSIEKKTQIEELIKADDGALAAELEKVESRDDYIKVFAARGVELTEEEADEMLKDLLLPTDGELNDDDLEGVAGGITFAAVLAAVKKGWGIGARAGMLARMLYDKIKTGNAYANYNWKNVITGKVGIKIFGISI